MTDEKNIAELLAPMRRDIDALDQQLVDLLAKRMAVVHQVSKVKYENNIPAILPDRVKQVRDNALTVAEKAALDPVYIGKLWDLLIAEACRVEQAYFDARDKKSKE